MKYFKLLVLLIAPVLVLSSCKKSNESPAVTYTMSFKVNGTLVNTDTQVANIPQGEKTITIDGFFNGQNSNMQFFISNNQVGTYDVVKDKLLLLYYNTEGNTGTYYEATSGTFTITTISATLVTGTFQFTASDTNGKAVTITEGKFSVNIPKADTSK